MNLIKSKDHKLIASLNEPVQKLHHKLYPELFKPFDESAIEAYFENAVNNENSHFLICCDDEEPLGYIWFDEVRRSENAFRHSRDYVYINQVSVNEVHRGKGAGKLLFDSVIDFAAEKSIQLIGLDYWAKNKLAKEIYGKYGFNIEKEVAFFEI